MSTKKSTMKEKLENMQLRERINYGYKMVIIMMLVSGLLSVVVIGVLFSDMMHYVNKVNAADQAVKVCRINVSAAARNIREMALNPDTSSYDGYEQGVKTLLEEVDAKLKIIKNQEPLHAIEDVAKDLTEGNLHSTLEYRSEDEIGRLAHSMRKSIRILGSYVDDIDRAMKLFAEGHFDVQPEVEWKGDFIGILHSFMGFEKSMAATIKGIQNVSGEVSGAAEQVASSSNDLADGVTNQAAVVANQVNMLADQSAQAAKESTTLIETSVKAVENGMVIAERTATQLEEVAESLRGMISKFKIADFEE